MQAQKVTGTNWKDRWFARVHGNRLIYNTCWEDPVADKAGLELNENSRILMITSAGCNALSYLLENPAKIDCVDLNYRQNALLDLKMAAIRNGEHQLLFELFGQGVVPNIWKVYFGKLRPSLTSSSRSFWDQHLYYFSGKGIRKSFYQHGTAGILAFLAGKILALSPGLKRDLKLLFEAPSIEEQRKIYHRIEPRLLSQWLRPLLDNHVTMSMAGVPADQQELVAQSDPEGLFGYLKKCLRNVFLHLPARENYFWRLYLDGRYTPDCCPEYLEPSNMNILGDRLDRISLHTDSMEGHLKKTAGAYSHFILLDHQDWLARRDAQGLIREWEAIFAKAAPGARILMRSASEHPDFIPAFALRRLKRITTLENEMKARDRVGTYLSTWLFEII